MEQIVLLKEEHKYKHLTELVRGVHKITLEDGEPVIKVNSDFSDTCDFHLDKNIGNWVYIVRFAQSGKYLKCSKVYAPKDLKSWDDVGLIFISSAMKVLNEEDFDRYHVCEETSKGVMVISEKCSFKLNADELKKVDIKTENDILKPKNKNVIFYVNHNRVVLDKNEQFLVISDDNPLKMLIPRGIPFNKKQGIGVVYEGRICNKVDFDIHEVYSDGIKLILST